MGTPASLADPNSGMTPVLASLDAGGRNPEDLLCTTTGVSRLAATVKSTTVSIIAMASRAYAKRMATVQEVQHHTRNPANLCSAGFGSISAYQVEQAKHPNPPSTPGKKTNLNAPVRVPFLFTPTPCIGVPLDVLPLLSPKVISA